MDCSSGVPHLFGGVQVFHPQDLYLFSSGMGEGHYPLGKCAYNRSPNLKMLMLVFHCFPFSSVVLQPHEARNLRAIKYQTQQRSGGRRALIPALQKLEAQRGSYIGTQASRHISYKCRCLDLLGEFSQSVSGGPIIAACGSLLICLKCRLGGSQNLGYATQVWGSDLRTDTLNSQIPSARP